MTYEEIIRSYAQPLSAIPTSLVRQGALDGPIHAVFFDIYGTLIISSAGDIGIAVRSSENRADQIDDLLKRHNFTFTAEELSNSFYNEIEGVKTKLRAQGTDCPEVIVEDIWIAVLGIKDPEVILPFAIEYECIVNPVHPMPNLKETIAKLRALAMRLGVVSNGQFYTPYLFPAFLGADLQGLGFEKDFLFFSYRHGYSKPSLELYKRVAAQTEARGLSPSEVLYVGNDMLNDIWASAQVGFKTALFAGDKRSLRLREDDRRCRNLRPDLVVTDLLQIVESIEGQLC
ncbi:MAG: HAD family hydrolase [Deltaproteobacteria bacterium]|nr:HAD family hydrolase [Deltaproteobacteria bacterium]